MSKVVTSFERSPRILYHMGYGKPRVSSIGSFVVGDYKPRRYAVVKEIEESPGRPQTRMIRYDSEFPILEEDDQVKSAKLPETKYLMIDCLDDRIFTEVCKDLNRIVRQQREYNCIILHAVQFGITAEEAKRAGKLYRTHVNRCENGVRDVRFEYRLANCPLFENVFEEQMA